MTYKELMEMNVAIQQALAIKRANEVKDAIRILMDTYGLTKDEMKSYLDGEDSINPVTTQDVDEQAETVVIQEEVEDIQTGDGEPLVLPESSSRDDGDTDNSINPEPQVGDNQVETAVIPEVLEDIQTGDGEPLALPESSRKDNRKTEVSINPEPQEEKNVEPKTPVVETEGELPTMDSLLSGEPAYKAFYHPVTPVKKAPLPTMEELLSGEPGNRILTLGNLKPAGSPHLQHTRISHTGGIIPTIMASGQTIVYIPAS